MEHYGIFEGERDVNPVKALHQHGQTVWLDYLARSFIKQGELKTLIERGHADGGRYECWHHQMAGAPWPVALWWASSRACRFGWSNRHWQRPRLFIAAAMDNHIRAFDVENGVELWRADLPAGGQATPMDVCDRRSAVSGHRRWWAQPPGHHPRQRDHCVCPARKVRWVATLGARPDRHCGRAFVAR
jgi:hypothetical protein